MVFQPQRIVGNYVRKFDAEPANSVRFDTETGLIAIPRNGDRTPKYEQGRIALLELSGAEDGDTAYVACEVKGVTDTEYLFEPLTE